MNKVIPKLSLVRTPWFHILNLNAPYPTLQKCSSEEQFAQPTTEDNNKMIPH
jgi:hypothetical protein